MTAVSQSRRDFVPLLSSWFDNRPSFAIPGRGVASEGIASAKKRMEEFLLGRETNPQINDPEIADFWNGLPENLEKLENIVWAENPKNPDDFSWVVGGDGVSRVWHPGVSKDKNWGWAGTPDIVCEYKGKVVLGDLKTSNGPYYARWPGADTPKKLYGMKRAGFMKYSKCQMQMAAYALALEHTVNIKPELIMTFVATREDTQVFVIQSSTIEKYKQKWLDAVEKYYTEILPAQEAAKLEMDAVNEDKKTD